jgi:ribonuclease HII
MLDLNTPQTSIPKGDALSLSIAAASVLAKTSRDAILCELDEQYPGYGFVDHKGYGTAFHLEAIRKLGPTPIHRMTFAPLNSTS